jgi:hypothetical protein
MFGVGAAAPSSLRERQVSRNRESSPFSSPTENLLFRSTEGINEIDACRLKMALVVRR